MTKEVVMPERKVSAVELDHDVEQADLEQDEVDVVLSALRHLYQKVSSPVIRACLEAARSDIAYLASTGEATAVREEELEEEFEDENDSLAEE
jgi:hypothetical protein